MDKTLRQLQLTQLQLLNAVDRICKQHNINYSLYAGTLLGAVRHKGFIPWDDDLDICMARDDYDRFVKLWSETEHDGLILQNKDNTPGFTQSFTKIRKNHTTFLQGEHEIGKYHTGIFIDIFPIDRCPNKMLKKYIFYFNCMYYQLLCREFAPRQYGKLIYIVSQIMLFMTPHSLRFSKRKKLLTKITAYNHNHSLPCVAIEAFHSMRKLFPSNMMDNYTNLQFADGFYMCYADWDTYLRQKYGNYMQLPPEEDRVWTHHPILIDFEHNYEDLVETKEG